MISDSLPSAAPETTQTTKEPTAAELSCTVYDSFEAVEGLREDWDAAVERCRASVYMTFDWVRTWWQFYGRDAQLRLFVFRSANVVECVFPVYIDVLGIAPMSLRIARLVGANIPAKVFDPPVPASIATRVFEELLARLIEDGACDVLSFGPVSDAHKPSAELAEVARRRLSSPSCVQADPVDVHTLFRLPTTLDEYFDRLSKSESKRRKYELRALSKEFTVCEDVVRAPDAVEAEFEAFAEQHRANWDAQGKPGHFGSWPRALEYNRALVRNQAGRGRVRFYRILANGEVISRQYAYVCGGRGAWELPSRAMGGRWDKLSLGTAGVVRMFEAAMAEGVREFEGGIGHYEYKLRLGAEEHPIRTIRVWRPGISPSIRRGLWRWVQKATYIGYQAIWHRRLLPRLPASFRRPQPHFCVRLDY